VYLIGFVFGYDCMVFPGILSDDIGIFKSFFPIMAYQYRQDNSESLFFRILLAIFMISVVVLGILFWQYTSIVCEFFLNIYTATRDWGLDKMEQLHNGSTQVSYRVKNDEYMRRMGDI
jgi:hypothetical protein